MLVRLARGPCSGAALARESGLTRAAVWKHIASLRSKGLAIAAVPGDGYTLASSPDLLDAGRIQAGIPKSLGADLERCEVVWEIDSTNAELLRRPAGVRTQALLAEMQTAGRGRRGRAWASPLAAHLYLSLQRRFDGGVAALAGLSIAVGVATAEALRGLGAAGVGLKWPNDLVAGDRKLGGILIEFGGEEGGFVRVVIGIGINVRMPAATAAAIDQPWVDLAALTATPPARNVLASAVLTAQLAALREFDAAGLAPFLPRWATLDACAGRAIEVIAGDRRETGVALGIDARGALRVRHGEAERHYHSAEVSVRRR